MSERLPEREASGDPHAEADPGSTPSPPRRIPVLGVAVAILIVLIFVVLHLTGAVGPGVR
jgi:hypothetical protein